MLIVKFLVVEGGNQVKPQAKPLAPISVTLRQNAEDFQAADHMLDHEPLFRQKAVLGLLLLGERMQFALLVRQTAVGMTFVQAQVAAVCQTFGLRRQRRSALLEQCEVMHLARTKCGCQDAPAGPLNQHLSFLGMALLFAAVCSGEHYFV